MSGRLSDPEAATSDPARTCPCPSTLSCVAIVRGDPAFILEVWEGELGCVLSPESRELFLERYEVAELCKLPREMIRETAQSTHQRNSAGHLLLVEWLDVAAERLESMLARIGEVENSLEVTQTQPGSEPVTRVVASEKVTHLEDPQRQPEPEPVARARLQPQAVVKEVKRNRHRPCRICGKRSVHAFDCSRWGTEFEDEPIALVHEEIEYVYAPLADTHESARQPIAASHDSHSVGVSPAKQVPVRDEPGKPPSLTRISETADPLDLACRVPGPEPERSPHETEPATQTRVSAEATEPIAHKTRVSKLFRRLGRRR